MIRLNELEKVLYLPYNKATLIIDYKCDFETITDTEEIIKTMRNDGSAFIVTAIDVSDDGTTEIQAEIANDYPEE